MYMGKAHKNCTKFLPKYSVSITCHTGVDINLFLYYSVGLVVQKLNGNGVVVQWLARPLVTAVAGVRSPDQAHY